MSVVVCVKDKDFVYLGCDSQVSSSRSKFTLTNKNNYKIWKPEKYNNDVMIGGVGNLREINVLMVEDDLIDELALMKNEIDFKYVVKQLVPRIYDVMEQYNLVMKDSDEKQHLSSTYIIVIKNHVYEIGSYGSVIEIDDYTAIGSGQDIALGSLNTTLQDPPVDRIIKAIEASCKTNLYVNYPIIITSNKNCDIQVIHSNK